MNRYLLLGIVLMALVVGVQGLALDFQNPSDFSEQVSCPYSGGTSNCLWFQNTTGGNSYVNLYGGYVYFGNYGEASLINAAPQVMTYSAATMAGTGNHYIQVRLYDAAMNLSVSIPAGDSWLTVVGGYPQRNSRIELIIVGFNPSVYINGNISATGGSIVQNPTYVGWRDWYAGNPTSIDDIIWGDTGSTYIFGNPENGYFLSKDILNPAASGFYRVNQTVANGSPTLISSTTFTSTFGKPNGNNQTVVLASPTGGAGLSYDTGSAYAGEITWNLTQFFAQPTTGYGLYQTGIESQPDSNGFAVSEWIPYIGSGAWIQFDKNSYAIGETATLSVEMAPAYYTAVTSPHVVIKDIWGTEIYDTPITLTSSSPNYVGTATYTWTDDNDEGVYYGLIYATYNGEDVLMNYDSADLNSLLVVNGYVFDAETAVVISSATVNVTQGSTTDSLTTAADGNYSTTSAFTANVPTTIVASKTAYETYSHTFTPLYAGTIQINLTLMPTSPTYTGIALGGIARTPPYNRTINSARVDIVNSTDGHSYSATTNSVGYYIQNNMVGASHWFDVWGSKTGFSNSSIYQKLVVGV